MKRYFNNISKHVLLLIVMCCACQNKMVTSESDSIFDGDSFIGWEGSKDFFRIEDQSIVAGSMEQVIPKNQFLCTEKEFEDFELSLQVKFICSGNDNNGGIQFRSKRIPNHHEVEGYQADLGYTSTGTVWGGMYDESRRRKFLVEPSASTLEIINENGWNDYKIRCDGDHIQFWINGQKVLDYIEEDPDIASSGSICVQIHSGPPAEAWYREIRLREIEN